MEKRVNASYVAPLRGFKSLIPRDVERDFVVFHGVIARIRLRQRHFLAAMRTGNQSGVVHDSSSP
jgi:hypothetical protein